MGLQSVRRHPGIIAPPSAEEGVPTDRLVACAIEVFEDCSLLLREPHLLTAARIEQQLRAGAEGVWTDGENCVIAVVALTQVGTQPREQHAQPERLCHVVVRTRIEAEDSFGIAVRA